jgi:aminopeptidase YwaD
MDEFDLAPMTERLRRHVERLAQSPRPPGSPEHLAATEYIREHLEKAGFRARHGRFQAAEFVGVNLLTQPAPDRDDLPLLIIGAHYDSTPKTPGADDNASAVAALLELAAWIQPRLSTGARRCRLQLVAYDLEEYGMIGSYQHSRALRQSGVAVAGMVSLEMLAYTDRRPGSQRLPPHLVGLYPDVGNFIGVVGNEASTELLRDVTAGMKTVSGLPVEFIAVPGVGEAVPETRLSDHSAFWDDGFPALMITDTSFFRNPHYHQASDTPETLDYPFLAKVTAGVCRAVERLL